MVRIPAWKLARMTVLQHRRRLRPCSTAAHHRDGCRQRPAAKSLLLEAMRGGRVKRGEQKSMRRHRTELRTRFPQLWRTYAQEQRAQKKTVLPKIAGNAVCE